MPRIIESEPVDETVNNPPQQFALRFTGTGAEYFRIWLVNLLLSALTLGLYVPWARQRTLKYFYRNTWLANSALDFHGDPWRMLRGWLVIASLVGFYSFGKFIHPLAPMVALSLLMLLSPALLCMALRFRLANTSWRGLRFHFLGTIGEAYRAQGLALLFYLVLFAALGANLLEHPEANPKVQAISQHLRWLGWWILGGFLATPYFYWLLKRYQHQHYALGALTTRFTATPWPLYGIGLRAFGMALGSIIVLLLLGGLCYYLAQANGLVTPEMLKSPVGKSIFVLMGMFFYLVFLFISMLIFSYAGARTYNFLWSHTHAPQITFEPMLRAGKLIKLTLKNNLLILLTLGLYYPFAKVATYRLKVEAMSLATEGTLDTIIGQQVYHNDEAMGDAAAEIFGIDIAF